MHNIGERLQGALTSALINYVSRMFRGLLKDHPVNKARVAAGKNIANVILLRGCGMRLRLPSFQERHALRSCIVAPTKILGGATQVLTPNICYYSSSFGKHMVRVKVARGPELAVAPVSLLD